MIILVIIAILFFGGPGCAALFWFGLVLLGNPGGRHALMERTREGRIRSAENSAKWYYECEEKECTRRYRKYPKLPEETYVEWMNRAFGRKSFCWGL